MRTWFDDSATAAKRNRNSSLMTAPRSLVCLGLCALFPLLLGATCGLEPCDVFNCDTLPFIEELLTPDEHAEDTHDDTMDGMINEDDEHLDGEDDMHDDMAEEHDEDMPEDDDDHDEGMDGDDHDADAEDPDEDEEG